MGQPAPIELPDDGLRETKRGTIGRNAPFICMSNPMLVAEVIALRSLRKQIAETNWRRFHDSFEEMAA
jgi:hypothetical protein